VKTGHNEVDAWMTAYDNPMKDVVQRVREIVLATDDRITECIKWSYPTFVYGGPLATFFSRSTRHASLMFHKGASIVGEFPHLSGDAHQARTFRVTSVEEAEACRAELTAIVEACLALNDL
jgi:hypothetical protein